MALDIGNSCVDVGIFRNREMERRLRVYTNVIPEFSRLIGRSGRSCISNVIICSVVPEMEDNVITRLKKSRVGIHRVSCIMGGIGGSLVRGAYRGLGEDRQVALWMGMRIRKPPVIVIDFGTAVTVDVAGRNGRYVGGVILPGMDMWARALNEGTALLPYIRVGLKGMRRRGGHVLGRNTRECIEAGLAHGFMSMLDGLVGRIEHQLGGKASVVLCGGDSGKMSRFFSRKHCVDDMLILKGLRDLYYEVWGGS